MVCNRYIRAAVCVSYDGIYRLQICVHVKTNIYACALRVDSNSTVSVTEDHAEHIRTHIQNWQYADPFAVCLTTSLIRNAIDVAAAAAV